MSGSHLKVVLKLNEAEEGSQLKPQISGFENKKSIYAYKGGTNPHTRGHRFHAYDMLQDASPEVSFKTICHGTLWLNSCGGNSLSMPGWLWKMDKKYPNNFI